MKTIAEVHARLDTSQPKTDPRTGHRLRPNKGIARAYRALKRLEAERRNEATHPERRRSYARSAGYSRNSDRIRHAPMNSI